MNYRHQHVTIRTELRPGDLGQVLCLHGWLYAQEYQYDLSFEGYVAGGLHEFAKITMHKATVPGFAKTATALLAFCC